MDRTIALIAPITTVQGLKLRNKGRIPHKTEIYS